MQRRNPFIYGEIVERPQFVNREKEVRNLVRDVSDGQKVFLLSPRRFGKSSLVGVVFEALRKRGIHTAIIPVSSYASYSQFLEKFAEKVLKAAGPWQKVKDWAGHFLRQVTPQAKVDLGTGDISISLGRGAEFDPSPVAPEVFSVAGELARKGGFRMAICLDEFQQISTFDGESVEAALRDAIQRQRGVGYVFAGSQPSLMDEMLGAKRPFHKAGPVYFLDKIPKADWEAFILGEFGKRGRTLAPAALESLLSTADLIPYDVQRIAHELWDYAELAGKKTLEEADVRAVVEQLKQSQSDYYERLWEHLSRRQRAVLQALASRGAASIYSQAVRNEYGLGPSSSVQKALASLDAQDILDQYKGSYFFVDPLFSIWIKGIA